MGENQTEVKQVIVMRRDLNMRKGKMIAQGAHASVGTILSWDRTVVIDSPSIVKWFETGTKKIVVSVNSEQELLEIFDKAGKAGLRAYLVKDSGLTEFNGEPTLTCLAIGPASADEIDRITKNLPLL